MTNSVLIDWSITEDFLEAIGRSTGPIVFAVYPSDPSRPCIHIKADAEDIPRNKIERILARNSGSSLGFVVNPPSEQPAVWGTKPEHINRAGEIKAWGASNAHIAHAIACFAECDGNLDREAQAALPAMAGLPEPTVSVWTGGKSLHHYWLFTPGANARLSPRPGPKLSPQMRSALLLQRSFNVAPAQQNRHITGFLNSHPQSSAHLLLKSSVISSPFALKQAKEHTPHALPASQL
jgi:hypothetical protein